MKNILITGASGFIGSFYVDEALRKGWNVWAGVRKTSSREFLTDPAIHFIDLNYSDVDGLQHKIENHIAQHGKWDYVIHSAGITKGVSEADFDRVNHIYTTHLVEALKRSGNVPEKFVYMSSLGALGPGDEINYTHLRPEDTPHPNSAYGRSKIRTEQYLQSLPDFPYVILRPTGVYGPREKDYYMMVRMVNAGWSITVGSKPQLLNFIYVKDLVKVCFSAIESPLQNKTWFVADGDDYTSQDYTDIVKKALHKKQVLNIILPMFLVKSISVCVGLFCKMTGKISIINPDKIKIIEQRNWTCDISSLEKDLGFKAEYNLKRGMEETVAWYREKEWL